MGGGGGGGLRMVDYLLNLGVSGKLQALCEITGPFF